MNGSSNPRPDVVGSTEGVELHIERCPVCGGQLDTSGSTDVDRCPHCGRVETARGGAGSKLLYEEKTVVCAPYELERATKAEAVDGWYLVDTIVSAALPGMIEAHFRRPVHEQQAPATPATPPKPAATPRPAKSRKGKSRPATRKSTMRGASPLRAPSFPLDHLVFLILFVAGLIWAADNFGVIGILLALWLLPRFLRSVLGLGRRRTRRR